MADEVGTPGTQGRQFNPNELFTAAFGYLRPPFPKVLENAADYGVNPVGAVKALKGAFNLKTKIGSDIEYTFPTSIDGWQIPQEPAIRIRGGKNVIQTELNRGAYKQNVLEEINLNNYMIQVRGLIINEDDPEEYPEVDVRRLREIFEKQGSVKFDNGIATMFGINLVAFVNLEIFEIVGEPGVQAFQMDLISDQDFALEISGNPEQV